MSKVCIKVGQTQGDIITQTNVGLQAAIDYVSCLGGGVVEILSGQYRMNDSLHLRSGITLRGQGDQTVLMKDAGVVSRLAVDGDYGEEQITVTEPKNFSVGMGLNIMDDRAQGFHVTVATVIGVNGEAIQLNSPLRADYLVDLNAKVANAFPIISGYNISNVVVESLAINGNKEQNQPINGCRGAGIYLNSAESVVIRNCSVLDFYGDGISYQKSHNVVVENCVTKQNSCYGLHPGSGSQCTIVRNCSSTHNGQVGLFICWRVKHGIFEGNTLCANGKSGISIGHKDTDNVICDNIISNNAKHGIYFRPERIETAAHDNIIKDNQIIDNGDGEEGYGIRIDSLVHGVVIQNNTIGNSPNGQSYQKQGVFSKYTDNEIDISMNHFSTEPDPS